MYVIFEVLFVLLYITICSIQNDLAYFQPLPIFANDDVHELRVVELWRNIIKRCTFLCVACIDGIDMTSMEYVMAKGFNGEFHSLTKH